MTDRRQKDLNQIKKRIWELDFIRGVCILLVLMDHIFFDLAYLFPGLWFPEGTGQGFVWELCLLAKAYWVWPLRVGVRYVVVFLFVFICGASCSLSRSNLKRGLQLAAVAVALTLFTMGMDWFTGHENYYTIRFGILHMLAASILLYCLLKKLPTLLLAAIGFLLAVFGVYAMCVTIEVAGDWPAYFFCCTGRIHSADYFPLLPWLGFFLLGTVFGNRVYPQRKSLLPRMEYGGVWRPFLFAGRHCLWFYLLHQPVVYVLLTVAGLFITGELRY